MSIGNSDIWVGGGIDQGRVGTVLPKVLLRWMPSKLSPLVVAAVSAAAAAAAYDDDSGGGGDDDDDDNDNDDNYGGVGQQYSEMKCPSGSSATAIFGFGAETIKVGLALFYQRCCCGGCPRGCRHSLSPP